MTAANRMDTSASATITVGAEASDVRNITVQVSNRNGRTLTGRAIVELIMLKDAAGADFVTTGGSTGLAIGASGKLLTLVAKKLFRGITTAAGVIQLTWTDTGTEVAYLGVRLPGGELVISAALTNA